MEMKSKKQRKLFLMMVMMLSTAAFISTATYAWFTANTTVAIEDIQVNVEAQGGIQVSADGTNWKSIVNVADLTAADLTYAGATNQIPTILEPVSSALTVDASGQMEMHYGEVTTNVGGDYILTATKEPSEVDGVAGKYVAFDLFFRLEVGSQLYLTPNSGVETPDATDTGIKNSTRMAFVNHGSTALGSNTATIQALNAGVAAPVYLWEPNYNSHTAPAIAHALDTYSLSVTDGGATVPYSGVSAPVAALDDVLVGEATEALYPAFFTAITPTYQTVNGFAANTAAFTLPEGISKVRIYMWVEGQDVDAENTASGGNATFNLQLTIDA